MRDPAALGLDAAPLDRLAQELGGRGCVVKVGCMVKAWGDQAERGGLAFSAKPVLSTLLSFAVLEGKVKSVYARVGDFGRELARKDRPMEFFHLSTMVSGYARPEPPGAAWAYNDYAIMLYLLIKSPEVFDVVVLPNQERLPISPARD
jgi:CubicO group peptidase (beta-lactamase class C family)